MQQFKITPAFIKVFLLLVVATLLIGCATPKQVTQLVTEVRSDTVYLSNTQYDSIYIYQDKYVDHRLGTLEPSGTLKPDTLYVRDVSIEYRYKLLKDTVRIVERDSIPYEVVVYKEKSLIPKPSSLNLIKDICFGICLSGLLIVLYKFIKYFRTGGILNH